ncbi:MAG TPA: 50S ribosomal protein L13 [Candidatus Saccharimonadia bacterium]|jgi:large subunit ribosomal protein L13|nr:50S ribosomal protein L13 [Candidatus Saccharimonadia bacterium]
MLKTYSPKPSELTHDWYLVDAEGKTLGRLATQIATYLLGKHKVRFSAHLDAGDNIVVINASKVAVTGAKLEDKKYYHHSGYPGGIKETSLAEMITRNPAMVIEKAVAGMLPKNRLLDDRLRRLKVYPGAEHPHAGQNPKVLGDN